MVTIPESKDDFAAYLDIWQASEVAVFASDSVKIKRVRKKVGQVYGDDLWGLAYRRVQEMWRDHSGQILDIALFKAAVMSVQSSLGRSVERCLYQYGASHSVALPASNFLPHAKQVLVATCANFQFIAEIRCLRKKAKGTKQMTGVATTNDEIAHVAGQYFVTVSYIKELLSNPRTPIRYPDIVVVFSDVSTLTVRICEAKLSGDNDSKAVTKNLTEIAALRSQFDKPGQVVETVVALPFAPPGRRTVSRWREHAERPTHVAVNAEVWSVLFGAQLTRPEYRSVIEHLAEVAANRIFHYIAPPDYVYTVKDGVWSWKNSTLDFSSAD